MSANERILSVSHSVGNWRLVVKSVAGVPEHLIFFIATSSSQGDPVAGEAVCGKSEQTYTVSPSLLCLLFCFMVLS